jgi:hypothetical protein
MGILFTNGLGIGTVPNNTNGRSGQWYLATGPFGYQPAWNNNVISWPMNTGNYGSSYGTIDPNEILGNNNAGIYINIIDSIGTIRYDLLSGLVGRTGTITFTQGGNHITFGFTPGTFYDSTTMYGSISWDVGSSQLLTLISTSNTTFTGYAYGDYNNLGGPITYISSGIAPNNSELVTISYTTDAPSFTLHSSDISSGHGNFNNYNGHSYPVALGTNGVNGFTLTNYVGDPIYSTYASNVPYYAIITSQTIVDLFNALVTFGKISSASEATLWVAEWAEGSTHSTTVVSLSGVGNINNQMYISPLDTTDSSWIQSGNNSTTLPGTYLFPAKFTLIEPVIDKGGWC